MKYFLLIVTLLMMPGVQAADIEPPFGIRSYDIGRAPNFILQDMDGERFEFDSSRGRWVFLHFWASWCGPCREEMPTIARLIERFDDSELQIVMVNTAEDEDTIFSFMAGIDMEPVSLLDADGQVTELWKPRGLPTTFLIDPQGRVRYQAIGGRDWHRPEYIEFLEALTRAKDVST